jgi:hypothetical protein
MIQKTQVFIGCSSESLEIGWAIQENLEREADCTVWDQSVFKLSESNLSSLIAELDKSDYGIFVLTPDDVTEIRKIEHDTPRDNVIFELGLFIGRLGAKRTFMVIPRGNRDMHLPTDLSGIIPAEYEPGRIGKNAKAALGPACNQIRKIIRDNGMFNRKSQPPEHLNDLTRIKEISFAPVFVGPWSDVHVQGIQKLAIRNDTKIIEVLACYRIGEIRRFLDNFKNKKEAIFRACFANMWDNTLADAYRRKFYDRSTDYMKDAVEDSVKKILGECEIRVRTPNNIRVVSLKSKPIADYSIHLTQQRITYGYYRIDDTLFIVPLDMRRAQNPPPIAWVIDKSILPNVFEYYTNEFNTMFEEGIEIYHSKGNKK